VPKNQDNTLMASGQQPGTYYSSPLPSVRSEASERTTLVYFTWRKWLPLSVLGFCTAFEVLRRQWSDTNTAKAFFRKDRLRWQSQTPAVSSVSVSYLRDSHKLPKKLFHGLKKPEQYHSDAVQGLKIINNNGLNSCSRDCTVKVWR